MLCTIAIILFTTLLLTIVAFYKISFQTLKLSNIPHPPPSIPFGNYNPLYKTLDMIHFHKKLYETYKKQGKKFFGFYLLSQPVFVPIDLDLIKSVLVKDFDHFMDRVFYYNEKDDPLSAHLFAVKHETWKPLRSKLTPTFTSGKIKLMFPILMQVSKQLEEAVEDMTKRKEPLDIRDVLGRFSTDIIGSCAFGIECNSFNDGDNNFRKYGKKVFDVRPLEYVRLLFSMSYPNIARKLGFTFNKPDVMDFFMKITKDMVKYRAKNNVTRTDILQFLIDLNNANVEDALTLNELAALAYSFFIAGFETSSVLMSFCLYELARNQDIQDKVRVEIQDVMARHDNELTYDGIKEMKYLGMVLDESMRMYPPGWFLDRRCVKEYKIPGGGVVLADTQVVIPVYAIHNDPEYYPDPDKFDPNRFSDEEKMKRHGFAFIPFGEGLRNCIGMRFGLMMTKVGICTILKSFKVTINERTKLPVRVGSYLPTIFPKDTIWLDSHMI